MLKPKDYDQAQVFGEFTPISLGGHYLVIKEVTENNENGDPLRSKSGDPMVRISFDTADNDAQPGYFVNRFRNDIRPKKTWPSNGCVVWVTSFGDKTNGKFKGFITSVKESNPGFSEWWPSDDSKESRVKWGQQFKDKLVGGVFGEEIGVYNNKETKQHKLQYFCSNQKVADAKIPNSFETKEYKSWKDSGGITTAAPDSSGFMNIPDGITDEELPFN